MIIILVDDQFVGDDNSYLHKLQYFQAAFHQSLIGSVLRQYNHLSILLGGRRSLREICLIVKNFGVQRTSHVHLDSRTFWSPIFSASVQQSTSKTLWLPIIITVEFPVFSWFGDNLQVKIFNLKYLNSFSHYKKYLFMIWTCSSMRLFSPMMIGPASAMIWALGWTTVFLPMVMSPFRSHSVQTTAPWWIFMLKWRQNQWVATVPWANIAGSLHRVFLNSKQWKCAQWLAACEVVNTCGCFCKSIISMGRKKSRTIKYKALFLFEFYTRKMH